MQRHASCADDGVKTTISSSPVRIQNQRQSSPRQSTYDEKNVSFLFTPSKTSLPCNSAVSFSTPSTCSFNEESNAVATENRLYLARLTLEYQELVGRYRLCLTHLEEAIKEAEVLRQENVTLRMTNNDLMNRLTLLAQNSLQNRSYLSSGHSPLSIINDFHNLCIGDSGRNSRVTGDVALDSPSSSIGMNKRAEKKGAERVSLPKSISIRSSGYLKMNQTAVNENAAANRARTIRLRVGSTPVISGAQRVYVPGAGEDKEEESPLEFDVYNQGMFKTELCNKWQETGTCPYGEHCQFAHGIGELRPVIRHPRYKTEVCRMVLSGDMCPYGHRCHFRHALTEQESFIMGGGCAN